MKKILNLLIILCFMFLSVSLVEARTYTSYNRGDKITVNVNDSTKKDFYVIENNEDYVKAILVGSLGDKVVWTYPGESCNFTNSVVDNELKTRTQSWTNTTNITLPSASDIVPGFDFTSEERLEELGAQTNPEGFGMIHLENLNNIPFYSLSNSAVVDYYTNSVIGISNSLGSSCDIYHYGYALTSFPFLYVMTPNQSMESSIRPIITVSKDYVDGGVYVSEDETLWNNYVEKFKTTSLVDYFNEYSVDISSTDSTLKVVLSDDSSSWTTNFTYSNGILTYVPSDTDEKKFFDSYWVINSVYALANLKGYSLEQLENYFDKEGLTLSENGIEYAQRQTELSNDDEGVNVQIDGTIFDSFKLNIKNGLSINTTEEPENPTSNEEVEVPNTALTYSIMIILFGIVLVGLGAIIIIRTKNKISNEG